MQYLPPAPTNIPLFHRYHTMRRNWAFSLDTLQNLRSALTEWVPADSTCTIAVAGSLARMEASAQSDADFIIIADGKDDKEEARTKVREIISGLGIADPKADGVFSTSASPQELIESIGSAEEDLGRLARRMLMLLESRPIFNDAGYESTLDSIFDRYTTLLKKEGHKQFVFMMNDLIRYFRAICVNYQSTFWRENEKWPLRNLKLRHSRVVMYSGLLFLLGAASKVDATQRVAFVRDNLQLTPLDRMALAYKLSGDDGFYRVAGLYDVFLSRISNEEQRATLRNLDYDQRYSSQLFSELKANSDALIAELMRFIRARQGDWSDRFFEYLLF